MPYYDIANLVTVTKTNMINEMHCGYGMLATTGVGIQHPGSHRVCAVVSAAPKFHYPNIQISLHPECTSITAGASGACENPLAESESTLESSRGGWEHLEVHKRTGGGCCSAWEDDVWFPDRITFCS
jgi:hypothetical protein